MKRPGIVFALVFTFGCEVRTSGLTETAGDLGRLAPTDLGMTVLLDAKVPDIRDASIPDLASAPDQGSLDLGPPDSGAPSCLQPNSECTRAEDCCSNRCTNGRCQEPLCPPGAPPFTIAEAQFPNMLAVDATHVYWTSAYPSRVMAAPVEGGAPLELAYGPEPRGLALTDTHVYWIVHLLGSESSYGALRRVPKTGGEHEQIARTPRYGDRLLLLDGIFFWNQNRIPGSIARLNAGAQRPQLLVTDLANTAALSSFGDELYWAINVPTAPVPESRGKLYSISTSGGPTVERSSELPRIASTAATSTDIFATTIQGLYQVPKNGDAPIQLSSEPASGIAVDGDWIYWSSPDTGELKKRSFTTGQEVTLASGQVRPHEIAIYGDCVYWTDFGMPPSSPMRGAIRRTAK